MEIDLNADIGEGFGPWSFGEDEALMRVISSANIACGFHAGDADIMSEMAALARENGVGVGAHVGFPDLIGFGRREIRFDPARFSRHVMYQIGALAAVAGMEGCKVGHMNFHGALGHMIAVDPDLADIMVGAVARYDRDLVISTIPGGETMRAAERHGLRAIGTFFADRAYDGQGKLLDRRRPDAVLRDSAAIAARVVRLLDSGTVDTVDGTALPLRARSILVHSDTPGAAAHATAIREAVERAGGRIVPLADLP